MTPTEPQKILIRWKTRDEDAIRRIRDKFNIPFYTSLNGLTPAVIPPERELFEETVNRGYFTYWSAEWSFDGIAYSW